MSDVPKALTVNTRLGFDVYLIRRFDSDKTTNVEIYMEHH